MSDQEKFLTRWSRRKLEPADEKVPVDPPSAAADTTAAGEDAANPAPARQAEAAPVPEFDLSKLPSLESIGADSDITAFLQAGVPSALKHAALRRAWSADPAIRDYIGPNENFWEGAGPDGVPGFGELDPNLDIKKLVAEVFGDAEPEIEARAEAANPAPTPEQSAQPPEKSDTAASAAGESVPTDPQHGATPDGESLLQRDANIATQHNDSQEIAAVTKARRHGGATPR
jgi:hypothetical protein